MLKPNSLASFVLAAGLAVTSTLAGETPPPKFTVTPMAVKAVDGKVKIEFAVDRETDVTVFIETADGGIVRHLVAGVLGRNPPEPLKAGALEQSLLWDGNDDDGKPVGNGPFKIRVGLGLKASWGGTVFGEGTGPNHLGDILGMAAGRDGRIYVMDERDAWLYWPSAAVHVFRRDGAYEKTIKPFPSHLAPERVKAIGAFRNDRGYLNPLIYRTLAVTFYPFEDEPAVQMAVSPDGRLYLPVVPSTEGWDRGKKAHLAALDLDGGIPNPDYAGPYLGKGRPWEKDGLSWETRLENGASMTVSSDGKHLYIVGLGLFTHYTSGSRGRRQSVVYRVPLPAMGPAELFFGDKKDTGSDEKHLNEPLSVAVDGKGYLYVADAGNNRVVVINESDGSFVGSFAFPTPGWVAVHPTTGAIYVANAKRLVKFSPSTGSGQGGWKDAKEQAALDLGSLVKGVPAKDSTPPPAGKFALDASADPPIVWMGVGSKLLRCEDRGDTFSDFTPANSYSTSRYSPWRPAVDPLRRWVFVRHGYEWNATFQMLDEATGTVKPLDIKLGSLSGGYYSHGLTSRLDRDGNIFSFGGGGIFKADPAGKYMPFAATAKDPELKGRLPGDSGTTVWERDHYVDRRGDLYAKIRGTAYHGVMQVDVFGQDGTRKRTALWGITDGAYGPRVDPKGNIYMMECVKPAGQPFPEEFKPHATNSVVQHWYDWMYGSIVKFPPAGGNIWVKNLSDKNKPLAEPVKLPDSMPKVRVWSSFRGDDNQMQGHLWMTPGVSHVGDMGVWGGGDHCHCTGCDFDVDDFGRSFTPDNGRQRITVLDTNGNIIMHFGAYGNQDYRGPESYVLDPAGKFLRPRKPDDPKDLKSPFAEPEIAFNWIIGVAVTDRHAYVGDCANRRMLRVKLGYAAEEFCPAP